MIWPMSDSDMVGVHKDDLAYLLAHVADELLGHPDRMHWALPLLRRAVIRLNEGLGENKLIELERLTPLQQQHTHETSAPEENPNRARGLLHGGEDRLSQDEIAYSFAAKRTPSARRIELLRDEVAAWLRMHGYHDIEKSITFLEAGAVGTVHCTRIADTAIFNIDVRGGYLYMRGDNE